MVGKSAAMNRWFIFYTGVTFLPVAYMLVLPSGAVNAVFYVLAFGIPTLAYMLSFLFSKERYYTVLTLMAIAALVCVTLLTGDGVRLSGFNLIRALKYYLCPLLIFLTGYSFAKLADRGTVLRTLLVVLCAHLVFSVLFVRGVLYSPAYDVSSSLYTENWVVTSGVLTAFTGLTLSKFDLAYQVGFILTGLLLFWSRYGAHKITVTAVAMVGLILLGCTYNKTMLGVVALTLIVILIRWLLAYSRVLGVATISVVCLAIGWVALQFATYGIDLTDIAIFLSPQTLLSRFDIWGEYARFDVVNTFQGYGAGFFDVNAVVVDNQFLYSYLELGAIPALTYFVLSASLIYRHSSRSIEAVFMMLFLGCVFLIGDMLSSIMVMYAIGVLFGASEEISFPMTDGTCTGGTHSEKTKLVL